MTFTPQGRSRAAAALRAVVSIACVTASTALAGAQTGRPADETLQALQERGRQIALYLQAVDRTADLVKTQGAGMSPPDRIVAIPESAGWRVVCLADPVKNPGATGTARPGLSLVAETSFSPDSGQVGTLGLIVPGKSASSGIQAYARALEAVENATLGRPDGGRPFVDAVIREKDSSFTVYVISQKGEEGAAAPASGARGGLVVGRDFIGRVAANGRQLVSLERLHEGVGSLSLEPRAAGAPLLHDHDRGDLPSPTDVALVVRYPVLAPLLVLTERFMFRVDKEGGVTWLGPNETPRARPSATPPAPGGGIP